MNIQSDPGDIGLTNIVHREKKRSKQKTSSTLIKRSRSLAVSGQRCTLLTVIRRKGDLTLVRIRGTALSSVVSVTQVWGCTRATPVHCPQTAALRTDASDGRRGELAVFPRERCLLRQREKGPLSWGEGRFPAVRRRSGRRKDDATSETEDITTVPRARTNKKIGFQFA